ncbi:MAG: hypothetical protein EHM28_05405, partial [Spirochaetaceae bacterium]
MSEKQDIKQRLSSISVPGFQNPAFQEKLRNRLEMLAMEKEPAVEKKQWPSIKVFVPIMGAAAACIIVLILLFSILFNTGKTPSSGAVIAASVGKWSITNNENLRQDPGKQEITLPAALSTDSGSFMYLTIGNYYSIGIPEESVVRIEYPMDSSPGEQVLCTLISGTIMVKSTASSVSSGLMVNTPSCKIYPMGTIFMTQISSDGKTEVTVLEGSVKIVTSSQTTAGQVDIPAGTEAVIVPDSPDSPKIQPINENRRKIMSTFGEMNPEKGIPSLLLTSMPRENSQDLPNTDENLTDPDQETPGPEKVPEISDEANINQTNHTGSANTDKTTILIGALRMWPNSLIVSTDSKTDATNGPTGSNIHDIYVPRFETRDKFSICITFTDKETRISPDVFYQITLSA